MKIRKKYRRKFDALMFAEATLEDWFCRTMNYYLQCKTHLTKQTQKTWDKIYKEYDLDPKTTMEYHPITKTIEVTDEEN